LHQCRFRIAAGGGIDHFPSRFGPPAADSLLDELRGDARWLFLVGRISSRRDEQRQLCRFLIEPAHLRPDDLQQPLGRAGRERRLIHALRTLADPRQQFIFARHMAIDLQAGFGQQLE
jgi:hypothetical protein